MSDTFTISFYDKSTGLIHPKKFVISDVRSIDVNRPSASHLMIHGHYDHLSQKVDIETGKIVDYQPPQPSNDHVWNADTKRWVLKPELQAKEAARREALARIGMLENKSARAMRDAILNKSGALERLKEIDDEILLLEAQL